MDMVLKILKMETYIKDSILMEDLKEKVSIFGLMELFIKGNLKMD
jgi:hypothetical protein